MRRRRAATAAPSPVVMHGKRRVHADMLRLILEQEPETHPVLWRAWDGLVEAVPQRETSVRMHGQAQAFAMILAFGTYARDEFEVLDYVKKVVCQT